MNLSLDYTFEELPAFECDGYWAGIFDGEAEITYFYNGEWVVSAISLRCDNRKYGKDAAGKSVSLSAWDNQLFSGLTNALEKLRGNAIQDRVDEALSDVGVRRRTDFEEHHTHWGTP